MLNIGLKQTLRDFTKRHDAVSSVIVHDTFTDSDDVTLNNHTPDIAPVGSVWSSYKLKISSNEVHLAGTNKCQIDVIETGLSDCEVEDDASYDPNGDTTVNSERRSGLIVRYADSGNFWRLAFNSYNDSFTLYEVSGGMAAGRTSATVATEDGVKYKVKAVLNGQSIKGTIDGGNEIEYLFASAHETATKHGIMLGYSGTVPAVDNFKVIP